MTNDYMNGKTKPPKHLLQYISVFTYHIELYKNEVIVALRGCLTKRVNCGSTPRVDRKRYQFVMSSFCNPKLEDCMYFS